MQFSKMITRLLLPALLFSSVFSACVKQEFDEPPLGGEPVTLETNATIAELKALHVTPGGFDAIVDDLVIGGVVIMDDRSGNYYKTLVLQDETGGIEIKFNDGFLYNQFPVGRTIYIRCQNLVLTDYNGLTQLTGSTVTSGGQTEDVGLTESQVRQKVVKGVINDNPPAPDVVSISQINGSHISTLITLEDVQFIKADTGQTYADPITNFSLNRILEDCNGLQIVLRTSGYADFAGATTPGGKGRLTGVLGIFGSTYQLYVRDLNDVEMEDLRCGDSPNGLDNLNESFDGTSSSTDIDLTGWTNIAVDGDRIWRGASFSGDKFASATAFSSNLDYMETWLVTPAINMSTQKTLSFNSSSGYYRHDGLTVWVSEDFDGSDVEGATWTQLDFTKPSGDPGGYTDFVPSGIIDLPVYSGKGWIGFKYTGDTNNNTTTWRFDDVIVQ